MCYSSLKKLWDELENYTQLPISAINPEISIILTVAREEEKVYQFLMGLNDEIFRTVRSNIVLQELIPRVKQVLTRICMDN